MIAKTLCNFLQSNIIKSPVGYIVKFKCYSPYCHQFCYINRLKQIFVIANIKIAHLLVICKLFAHASWLPVLICLIIHITMVRFNVYPSWGNLNRPCSPINQACQVNLAAIVKVCCLPIWGELNLICCMMILVASLLNFVCPSYSR